MAHLQSADFPPRRREKRQQNGYSLGGPAGRRSSFLVLCCGLVAVLCSATKPAVVEARREVVEGGSSDKAVMKERRSMRGIGVVDGSDGAVLVRTKDPKATTEEEKGRQANVMTRVDRVLPNPNAMLDVVGMTAAEAAQKGLPDRCTIDHLKNTQGLLVDLDGTIYNTDGLYPAAGPKKGEISREFHVEMTRMAMPMVYLSNGFKDKVCTALKLTQPGFDINRDGGQRMSELYKETHFWTAARAIALLLEEKFSYKEAKVYVMATTSSCGETFDNTTGTILRNVPEEKRAKWEVRMDLNDDEVEQWATWSARGEKNVVVVLGIERITKDTIGGNKSLLFDDDNNLIMDNFRLADPVYGLQRPAYQTVDYNVMQKAGRLLRNHALFVSGAPDTVEAHPSSSEKPEVDRNLPSCGSLANFFLTAGEYYPGSEKEANLFRSTGKGGKDGGHYMMRQGMKLMQMQCPRAKLQNGRVVMVGDNLLTDILAAYRVGENEEPFLSVLVKTGAHQPEDCKRLGVYPTCWVDDVVELTNLYKEIDEMGMAGWPHSEILK